MKKIILLFITIIFICGCSNTNITNEIRIKYAINDTSKTFKAYQGIRLGETAIRVDSIIKLDTQCYNINMTPLYRGRLSMGYIKWGFIESLYIFNNICTEWEIKNMGIRKVEKIYENQIEKLLEYSRDEPPYRSIFLDYILDENCYRTNIIIPIKNNLDKEYIEIDGWFSYKESNGRIIMLTCIFDEIIDNEEQLKQIVDGFVELLSEKYGGAYNLCDNVNLGLNLTNEFAWLIGGYEVQFFCNHYRVNKNTDSKCHEFIVRYIDNKFLQSEGEKNIEQKKIHNNSVEEKYNQGQKELNNKFKNTL